MRKLQFQDAFKVARIIKKADIREKLQAKVQQVNASQEKDVEKVGIEIIFTLFEGAGEVEHEVYELLAGVFEMETNAVKTMDFETLVFNCKKLIAENNIADFFRNATNLM